MKPHEKVPNIERVSDQEVWLLDEEDQRIRRICGKIRPGMPDEFPCEEDAGKDTAHENSGYCLVHDVSIDLIPKGRNTYERLINIEEKRTLLDFIVNTSTDESEHHTSVDSEIELLEAIIAKLVDANKDSLTTKGADDIAKVAQKLGNLKKIKIETLKKEKLDSEVIAKFLKAVMGIIKMHTSIQTSKSIIMDIITNVAVPMMNRDDMTKIDKTVFQKAIME